LSAFLIWQVLAEFIEPLAHTAGERDALRR